MKGHRSCPFCGGVNLEARLTFGDASYISSLNPDVDAELTADDAPANDPYKVFCEECDATGPTGYGSWEVAWELWDACSDAPPSRLSKPGETRLTDGTGFGRSTSGVSAAWGKTPQ